MLRRTGILAACLVLGLASSPLASDEPVATEEVLDLLATEVSEELILRQIEITDSMFELSVEEIIELKNAGASDELIIFMIETRIEPEAEAGSQPETIYERVYYPTPVYRYYVHRPRILRPIVHYSVPSVHVRIGRQTRYTPHRPRQTRYIPHRPRQTRHTSINRNPAPSSSRKVQVHRRADPRTRTFRRRWEPR